MQPRGGPGPAAVPEVVLLDGGMGHLLRRKGVEIAGAIGSQRRFLGVALANVDAPELVAEAHREFIAAGATVIITNNYAVVPRTLALADGRFGDADLERLTQAAARIAVEAANSAAVLPDTTEPTSKGSRRIVRVAGGLPPLRESYRFDQVPVEGELAEVEASYRRIATALLDGGVQILIAETMSCAREAVAAVRAAVDVRSTRWVDKGFTDTSKHDSTALPELWVAFTLSEDKVGTLRSGELVVDAIGALSKAGLLTRLDAVLFNCSYPESVSAALPLAVSALESHAPGKAFRVGGYANGFVSALGDGNGSDYDVKCTPEAYAETVATKWVEACGATIVGGCCGIFPEHIAALSSRLST